MIINIRNTIELIGVLAVILSLLFVGLEIRQSNVIAGREARTDIAIQFADVNRLILEEPSIATLRAKLRNSSTDLSNEEIEQALALAGLYTNAWGAANSAADSGVIPDEVIGIFQSEIIRVFEYYPGLCPFIENVVDVPRGFRIFDVVLDEIEKC